MMDFESFYGGIDPKKYKRLGLDYKVDIYLGYSSEGNYSIVVRGPGNITRLESTKFIKVRLSKIDSKTEEIAFNLLDTTLLSTFFVFCNDIIISCENVGVKYAISDAGKRWRYWREMFSIPPRDILSKSEIKGLIGELLFLRDVVMANNTQDVAVSCWMGPLAGHKDFEIRDTWYEIKATTLASSSVNISSIEQLDSDVKGHLIVTRLEDSNINVNDTVSLNKLVASVLSSISDEAALQLFRMRLQEMGYSFHPDYDEICFSYCGRESYSVEEGFPRLTKNCLPHEIIKANYSIDLPGIRNYLEE